MPADLAELLAAVAAQGRVVELVYHPDGDPGDGSGWFLLIDDRHQPQCHTLAAVADALRKESPDAR